MGDMSILDTIPATESDEVIKSSVENLVPIPSEFEGYFRRFVIDPYSRGVRGVIAPYCSQFPDGIVEADFDPNDDTSSDDDNFEDIEYVSLEEENDVDQEEKEFDLEDIFQIQDVILREKLLNVHRLISNIESLKANPLLIVDRDSSIILFLFRTISLPEFESLSGSFGRDEKGPYHTLAKYSISRSEDTILTPASHLDTMASHRDEFSFL
ncbi:hypothetical protein Tco_1532721 [Tanacetum coccineum]